MAFNQLIWAASRKRHRWILRGYSKRPRKKSPDPPEPPDRKTLPVETTKQQTSLPCFIRRDICLIRCCTATFNPLCRSRILAPLLAGSRGPLHRITKHYSRRGPFHRDGHHGSRVAQTFSLRAQLAHILSRLSQP